MGCGATSRRDSREGSGRRHGHEARRPSRRGDGVSGRRERRSSGAVSGWSTFPKRRVEAARASDQRRAVIDSACPRLPEKPTWLGMVHPSWCLHTQFYRYPSLADYRIGRRRDRRRDFRRSVRSSLRRSTGILVGNTCGSLCFGCVCTRRDRGAGLCGAATILPGKLRVPQTGCVFGTCSGRGRPGLKVLFRHE